MSFRFPITKQELARRAEELLPLTSAFDSCSIHIVLTDLSGNIIYANKAASEKTGFSNAEMLGKNPGDLWGGHMPSELYKNMWHTIKDKKQSWRGKVQNKRKDGRRYWQWLRVNPLLDDTDQLIGFISIEPELETDKKTVAQIRKELAENQALYELLLGRALKLDDLKLVTDALRKANF